MKALLLKPYVFLPAFTITHLLLTFGVFLYTFGLGMDRFDTGAEASSFETALNWSAFMLFFPLVLLLTKVKIFAGIFPGLLGYIPFVSNSLLWAFCAWLFLKRGFLK